jgi:acylphosphatase
MTRGVHVQVQGQVQGVGFREYARREAERLGVSGWVRNLRDGSVEARGDGEEAVLRAWIALLHGGPPSARVEGLREEWGDPAGLRGFSVRGTAAEPEPFHDR